MNIIQELAEWMRNASLEEQENKILQAYDQIELSIFEQVSKIEQQYSSISEPTIADSEKYMQDKENLEDVYKIVQELKKNITKLQEIKKNQDLQKAAITTAEIDSTIVTKLAEK